MPAAIEHVGGGYYLVCCTIFSDDDGWYDTDLADHVRWAVGIWLIRPDQTISEAWVSPGNLSRPYTQGGPAEAGLAPPYGEPTFFSCPKLTRWQEGALLSFTTSTFERQYVDDLADFWPQSAVPLELPYGANVYRWVGHDGTNPVVGDPLELYGGPDDDFPTKGDVIIEGQTNFDDYTTEGWEVIAPSADPNIAVYGYTDWLAQHRVWLLDKDANNLLTLTARTTFDPALNIGEPAGLTRVAAGRWVAMAEGFTAMLGILFDAKTGTVVDSATWDEGANQAYVLSAARVFYTTNHLHFDGTAVFAAWLKSRGGGVFESRYTTLTVADDILAAGPIEGWDTDGELGGNSARFVETCEGCLRIVMSWRQRRQGLFERGQLKAGPAELQTPEFEFDDIYSDQRVVPSSHPAGSMWAVNVSMAADAFGTEKQVEPWLVRYPA